MAAKKTDAPIVKWDEKLAKYAQGEASKLKNVVASGKNIRFGRGEIYANDTQYRDGLEVVIVGFVAHNRFYGDQPYDSDAKAPPICYSFNETYGASDMTPHEAVLDANRQHEGCAGCPKNVFGSARTGKGKACQNTLRVGMFLSDELTTADDITASPLYTASISATNVKIFQSFVNHITATRNRPAWSVVSQVFAHNDPKVQIRLEFKHVADIDDGDLIEALESRYLSASEALITPYQAPSEEAQSIGKSGKFARR